MATPPEERVRGKGEGAIYKDGRGLWTAVVELPPLDGTRRRKTIRSKDKGTVIRKLTAMKAELAQHGDLPTAGESTEKWLRVWFETIALKKVRPKTAATYRSILSQYIVPAIGKVPLDKLTPAHVRRMTSYITDKGLSSSTAMQAHRILAVALKYAEREGRVTRNVALLTDAPRRAKPSLKVLTDMQGIEVMRTVASDRLGSRIAAALLMAGRQGEIIGLEIDRVGDHLDLSWQLQRITWEHGCLGECGRSRGSECPARKITAPADYEHRYLEGGLWLSRPKSDAGWRIIPLVEPLRSLLEVRIEAAKGEPNPHGLVWTAEAKSSRNGSGEAALTGAPLDPRDDNAYWHQVLARACVPDVRLHDARHTAVDLLYAAGVPEHIIIQIVGHSTVMQSRAYKSRARQFQPQLVEAMQALAAEFTMPDGGRSGTRAITS